MPSLLSSSFGEKAETQGQDDPKLEFIKIWGEGCSDDGVGPGSFLAGTSRRSEAAVGGPRADDNRFFDAARCVAKEGKSQERPTDRPTGPLGGTHSSL